MRFAAQQRYLNPQLLYLLDIAASEVDLERIENTLQFSI